MDKNIILLGIQFVVAVVFFFAGKNIPQSVKAAAADKMKTAVDKLATLSGWAEQFVAWAKEFMKNSNGEEKMAEVVKQLKKIAEEAGLEVTEDQLKAIAQTAYNAMKAGEKETEAKAAAVQAMAIQATAQPLEAAAAVPVVNVYAGGGKAADKPAEGVTAVLTDNIPEDALEPNEDGTVNVYNAAGQKVGTISEEEAEAAAAAVTNVVVEAEDPAGNVTVEVEVKQGGEE